MQTCKSPETDRVSRFSLLLTALLAAMKLIVGLICASGALVSDGIHSGFDVICDAVVLLGIRIGARERDAKHPHGYGRYEYIASAMLSAMLATAAVMIAFNGISALISGSGAEAGQPYLAAGAALLSIAVKAALWQLTARTAHIHNSVALKACSRHHLADVFATLCALTGIIGAVGGLTWLDPLASVAISFFMFNAARGIFADSVRGLADRACRDETAAEVRDALLLHHGVIGLSQLICCQNGSGLSIEAQLLVPHGTTLESAAQLRAELTSALACEFGPQLTCALSFTEEAINRDAVM